jgi:hypothetical protein
MFDGKLLIEACELALVLVIVVDRLPASNLSSNVDAILLRDMIDRFLMFPSGW